VSDLQNVTCENVTKFLAGTLFYSLKMNLYELKKIDIIYHKNVYL